MNTGPIAVRTPMARVAAEITPALITNRPPAAADSAWAADACGLDMGRASGPAALPKATPVLTSWS